MSEKCFSFPLHHSSYSRRNSLFCEAWQFWQCSETHELMSDYTSGALTMMTMMNLWQWLSRVAYQCVATGVCLSDERFCVAEKRGRNDKTARFVICEMSLEVVTRMQQKCIVCSNTEDKTYQSEWMIYYYNITTLLLNIIFLKIVLIYTLA